MGELSESDAIVKGVVRGEKNHAGLGCRDNERRIDDAMMFNRVDKRG